MSQLWRAAQTGLRSRLAPHIFENWIQPIEGQETDNGLRLIVPSKFHAQWLQENYTDLLRTELQTEFSFEVRRVLRIIPGGGDSKVFEESLESGASAPRIAKSTQIELESAPLARTPLHPPKDAAIEDIRRPQIQAPSPHAFESRIAPPAPVETLAPLAPPTPMPSPKEFTKPIPFVAWNGTIRAAHCLHLFLQSKGQLPFNPLFLKSGPGMGKTALVKNQIVEIKRIHPEFRVGYISIPQFAKEMVEAITAKKMQAFHNRYQSNYDALIIDDIHFLEGKTKTQEEFQHLLNFFVMQNRPVVVLSQKSCTELELEDALVIRLQGGLNLEIGDMDLPNQTQLFKDIVQKEGIEVPQLLVSLLETKLLKSVSSLVSLVHQLRVHKMFAGALPEIRVWEQWIKPHELDTGMPTMSTQLIIDRVCKAFNVPMATIESPVRKKTVADARRVLVLFLREFGKLTYDEIGKLVGNRSHSTIMHILESVAEKCASDKVFERQVKYLREQL